MRVQRRYAVKHCSPIMPTRASGGRPWRATPSLRNLFLPAPVIAATPTRPRARSRRFRRCIRACRADPGENQPSTPPPLHSAPSLFLGFLRRPDASTHPLAFSFPCILRCRDVEIRHRSAHQRATDALPNGGGSQARKRINLRPQGGSSSLQRRLVPRCFFDADPPPFQTYSDQGR